MALTVTAQRLPRCRRAFWACFAVAGVVCLLMTQEGWNRDSPRFEQNPGPHPPSKVKILQPSERAALLTAFNASYNRNPGFEDIDCHAILRGDEIAVAQAAPFLYKPLTERRSWHDIEAADDPCAALHKHFVFPKAAFSEEEAAYPLAFGIIAYKSLTQVVYALSSLYQPQNVFAVIVDDKAGPSFKRRMGLVSKCHPNIHVMLQHNITWCQYSVGTALFRSFRFLAQLDHGWKYYQYLSGFDLPLKTNLEMVRIFKRLNGTNNIQVLPFNPVKLNDSAPSPPPLKLFKTSMSAAISRPAANYLVASPLVHAYVDFLKYVTCSDETLWASILGHPKQLPAPGSFDAGAYLSAYQNVTHLYLNSTDFVTSEEDNETVAGEGGFLPPLSFIARYQVWMPSDTCKGKYLATSCVYGLKDLPQLRKRPELVAHKLYFSYQPATFFCMLQLHFERALDYDQQVGFTASAYANLSTTLAGSGVPISEITNFR